MEGVCPLCNGLKSIVALCSVCGQPLCDEGEVEDYFGPYSPYTELDIGYEPDDSPGFCTHLLSCPACGRDTRIKVRSIRM